MKDLDGDEARSRTRDPGGEREWKWNTRPRALRPNQRGGEPGDLAGVPCHTSLVQRDANR